jgi:hypothetical protein
MPTAVHESLQFCFTNALSVAESTLPFLARSFCVQGEEMKGFSGEYAGSSKIADLAIQIKNGNRLENKMVFEICFSQDYDDLVKDAQLWLEGMESVNICVVTTHCSLFIIDEDFSY